MGPEDDNTAGAAFFDALAAVPNLRSMPFADVEMTPAGNGFKFDGIAAPVGVVADLGDFTEEYERGAFRRFLASNKANIPFLHEHNPRDLLATTRSGRLKLSEEVRGLRARADVVKTDLSERIKALVDAGDIGGMSVGMVVGKGNHQIDFSAGGRPHRRIQGFKKLLDVCTTFDPTYVSTEAQFRSLAVQLAAHPESLQQVLMGAYPQLQDEGDDVEGAREQPPADPADKAEGEVEPTPAGANEFRSIAARRRALQFLILTTGGIDDAS